MSNDAMAANAHAPMDPSRMTLMQKLRAVPPCPHCQAPAHPVNEIWMTALQYALFRGLVGHLALRALASKFQCEVHGKMDPKSFPPAYQAIIAARRRAMLGVAGVLLVLVVPLAVLVAML